MLLQLLLIGYVLAYIFKSEQALITVAVLAAMLVLSAWIALNSITQQRLKLTAYALIAIAAGGLSNLLLVIFAVLNIDPWFSAQTVIPLAGMVFAASMNSVSLAAERFIAELNHGVDENSAQNLALRAALIPVINSLFAVGLVSLPGMMTGQILSGVSPLIAARYQIIVMAMLFASSGVSAIVFLSMAKHAMMKNMTA